MRYFGPEYQQNGAVCQRTVVVEYDDSSGVAPGIITSFGAYLREA